MFKPSQETLAIVTVGLTLAALILITLAGFVILGIHDLRAEARADRAAAQADRAAWQAESDRLRTAWQAESDRLRAEDRARLEAWQAEARALRAEAEADREALGRLTGIVEEVRTARR